MVEIEVLRITSGGGDKGEKEVKRERERAEKPLMDEKREKNLQRKKKKKRQEEEYYPVFLKEKITNLVFKLLKFFYFKI